MPLFVKNCELVQISCPIMSAQQSVKRNLLDAIRYLLKPIIRLAIKNGILLPEFE